MEVSFAAAAAAAAASVQLLFEAAEVETAEEASSSSTSSVIVPVFEEWGLGELVVIFVSHVRVARPSMSSLVMPARSAGRASDGKSGGTAGR